MAVFRWIWVPLVSAAFNLLSIGAAYGVVVAVFQNGMGASLLGVTATSRSSGSSRCSCSRSCSG